jgi:hypothetical protein
MLSLSVVQYGVSASKECYSTIRLALAALTCKLVPALMHHPTFERSELVSSTKGFMRGYP